MAQKKFALINVDIVKSEMSNIITRPEVLLDLLNLDSTFLEGAKKAARLFGLRVPLSFIKRIEKGNPHDPLLLQVLPLHAELEEATGYVSDPLEEKKYNPIPGLLHKYHG